MKKIAFVLVGATALALAACGRSDTAAENAAENLENQAENLDALAANASNDAEAEALGNQAEQLREEAENVEENAPATDNMVNQAEVDAAVNGM